MTTKKDMLFLVLVWAAVGALSGYLFGVIENLPNEQPEVLFKEQSGVMCAHVKGAGLSCNWIGYEKMRDHEAALSLAPPEQD